MRRFLLKLILKIERIHEEIEDRIAIARIDLSKSISFEDLIKELGIEKEINRMGSKPK